MAADGHRVGLRPFLSPVLVPSPNGFVKVTMFSRIWADQSGAVVSVDALLVAVVLVIGLVVGLKSVRDAVVTELADVAQAVANLDQSYSFSGVVGPGTATSGAYFLDTTDFCDTSASENWTDATGSRCVNVLDSPQLFSPFDAAGNSIGEGSG